MLEEININTIPLIGIDYSLRSPAVAIYAKNVYTFFAFPRENTFKDSFIKIMQESGIVVTIVPNIINMKDLSVNERLNSIDSAMLAELVSNTIANHIVYDNIKIAIEGISFASPGNTKVQYAGYHYILRNVLHRILHMPYDNMYIYAPSSVKKTAGKGNFKKHQMIDAFITEDDVLLKKHTLYKTLNSNPELLQSPKAKHWMKPLDDIVDAFFTLKTLINHMNFNISYNN